MRKNRKPSLAELLAPALKFEDIKVGDELICTSRLLLPFTTIEFGDIIAVIQASNVEHQYPTLSLEIGIAKSSSCYSYLSIAEILKHFAKVVKTPHDLIKRKQNELAQEDGLGCRIGRSYPAAQCIGEPTAPLFEYLEANRGDPTDDSEERAIQAENSVTKHWDATEKSKITTAADHARAFKEKYSPSTTLNAADGKSAGCSFADQLLYADTDTSEDNSTMYDFMWSIEAAQRTVDAAKKRYDTAALKFLTMFNFADAPYPSDSEVAKAAAEAEHTAYRYKTLSEFYGLDAKD